MILEQMRNIMSKSGGFNMGRGEPVPKDLNIQIALGLIDNCQSFTSGGYNPSVSNSAETIWNIGGLYIPPASADVMQIVSDDAADTLAGTGLRQIKIYGLDENWININETVDMNGVSVKETIKVFLRVFKAEGVTAGTGLTNAGTITIKHKSEAKTLSQLNPGMTISCGAIFCVPADNIAIITGMYASLGVTRGKDVLIYFQIHDVANSIYRRLCPTILPEYASKDITIKQPLVLQEKTDLHMVAKASLVGTIPVSIVLSVMIIPAIYANI